MASSWYNPRRIIVTIVGGAVLLAGVVMLVTPGPALLVIPLGLAILATEYLWAANLLQRIRRRARAAADRLRGRRRNGAADSPRDGPGPAERDSGKPPDEPGPPPRTPPP